jgi:8-oxo-dGTP pyrophosphatase MutT (NUDIX family)
VKTIADRAVLQSLKERLAAVAPDSPRRWGTLTPHEMLCHLGDAAEMVLRIRPRDRPVEIRSRPLIKWLGIWAPLRWPHGWETNPHQNPRINGTRPSGFEADRRRAMAALDALASADPKTLEAAHGLFGRMSIADWQRWAYKHTDHHLRQFGITSAVRREAAPVFGERLPGRPYVVRPSAYALIRNSEGLIAVTRTRVGYFLPGGGIETGEDYQQAIVRESLEECGLIVGAGRVLCRATEIVYSEQEQTGFEKHCTFVAAEWRGAARATEPDHALLWMTTGEAVVRLTDPGQRWAVEFEARHHSAQ